MKLTALRNNPLFLIISIFLLIAILGKAPIKEYLPYSNSTSDKLETSIISSLLICVLIFIIHKLRIPHSYFRFIERRDYIYYFPTIIYIFLFSNGFSDFSRMSDSILYCENIFLYGLETLSRALFEEILFRGIIFGVILSKYYDSKNGVMKSVIISGLIFGLAHIVNIWTQPHVSARGTLNQVYAATCLGAMYCAIYLRTRSIIVLGLLHFISNFFAGIEELAGSEIVVESVSRDRTIIEIIASNVLTIVIFGSSLLIGIYIVKRTEREEVEEFMSQSHS